MSDQQHIAPGPRVGGDQMTGPPGLGHIDPAYGKAQRHQLGLNHLPDGAHTGQVQCAAVLVHQPFQQGDGALPLLGHRLRHGAFGVTDLSMSPDGQDQQTQDDEDQAHWRLPRKTDPRPPPCDA